MSGPPIKRTLRLPLPLTHRSGSPAEAPRPIFR